MSKFNVVANPITHTAECIGWAEENGQCGDCDCHMLIKPFRLQEVATKRLSVEHFYTRKSAKHAAKKLVKLV